MVDLIKDEKTRKKFMSASGFEELRAILQSFS
jgi:hypothetical protein